jgi:hypothetical protein
VGVSSRLPSHQKYVFASVLITTDRICHPSLINIFSTVTGIILIRTLAMSSRWSITIACVLALVFLSFTHPTLSEYHQKSLDGLTLFSREEPCPGIEGNSDLYGLGIRIGVYLQWFSAWISNTINPYGAASNHDANNIFLIAILIATTVALAGDGIQPVEAYIMLLLSSGFVFTVLSFLGVRLHLLRPSSTRQFRDTISIIIKNLVTTLDGLDTAIRDPSGSSIAGSESGVNHWLPSTTMIKRLLKGAHMTFGLKSISSLKHPALSWAGGVARCLTGTFLAVVSILVWWKYSTQSLPSGGGPCTPVFFFFGVRTSTGSMLWFFRVAAILLAAPVAYSLSIALLFMLEFANLGGDWIYRYGIIKATETIKPGAWDALSDEEKQSLRALLRPNMRVSAAQPLRLGADVRPLLHLLRSIIERDQATPAPAPLSLADTPHLGLGSIAGQSHHGDLPHDATRSSNMNRDSALTDAPRTNISEAGSHIADTQEMVDPVEVKEGQQPDRHHSIRSKVHHAGSSGQTQDKSSWQIKATELPHFSVLLLSFMSLWDRPAETGIGPKTKKLKPIPR